MRGKAPVALPSNSPTSVRLGERGAALAADATRESRR